MFVEIDQAIRPPELGNKLSSVRNYLGSFDAITSIFSIEGDFARSSAAFSIKAWATLTIQMRIPTGVIRERVENLVPGRSDFNCKP